MDIQDLGAIGEFVSSIVIVVTLIFLVYEVRATKRATIENNAHERHRARDLTARSVVESPHLARIMVKTWAHLTPPSDIPAGESMAREFGLEPHEFAQFHYYFQLLFSQWRDSLAADLPTRERAVLESNVRSNINNPAFAKLYEVMRPGLVEIEGNPAGDAIALIDKVRAALAPA